MPDFEGFKGPLLAEVDPESSGVDIIDPESGFLLGQAFANPDATEPEEARASAAANARLWANSYGVLKAAGDFIVTYRTEHGDPGRRDVRAAFDNLQAAVTACLSATVETREAPIPPPEAETTPA